jgi:SRSO17 transposase
MSLLEHPQAVALLADAVVSTDDVRSCRGHLDRFLKRYLPKFQRQEQRGHAGAYVRGLLSGLQRKSIEPIAGEAGIPRKNLQMFVGQGLWDDEAVTSEIRHHVVEELAEPDGVIVLDGSGFPKKGTHSCGVARQWCGRLGKKESCQIGVFLAYVGSRGHAPLDRRLYLPKDWADDPDRREAAHVPEDVVYRKVWEIADDLLKKDGPDVPHGWVVGDDEFGRASDFRARLRVRRERYVLDVPCNTTIRDLDGAPPPQSGRPRRSRKVPFLRVDSWVSKLPADGWTKLEIRDGAKGPIVVEAATARVQAKLGRKNGPQERLVVIRTLEVKPKLTYAMTNAAATVPLADVVKARLKRHRVERVFEEAKGEVGLADYEVRSWVGWHHHVTLSLLALWFLILERQRIGGENPGDDSLPGASHLHGAAGAASGQSGADRRGDQPGAAPQRGGPDLPLAFKNQGVSPSTINIGI